MVEFIEYFTEQAMEKKKTSKKIKYRKKKKTIVVKEAVGIGRTALLSSNIQASDNSSIGWKPLENSEPMQEITTSASEDSDKHVKATSGLLVSGVNYIENTSENIVIRGHSSIPFWKRMLTFLGISRNK